MNNRSINIAWFISRLIFLWKMLFLWMFVSLFYLVSGTSVEDMSLSFQLETFIGILSEMREKQFFLGGRGGYEGALIISVPLVHLYFSLWLDMYICQESLYRKGFYWNHFHFVTLELKGLGVQDQWCFVTVLHIHLTILWFSCIHALI